MSLEAAGAREVRQESTGVHSGVDRPDADGIGIFGPESTNPSAPAPSKKPILPLRSSFSKIPIDVN